MWFFIKITEGVKIKGKNTVLFDDFMMNKTADKKLYLKNTKYAAIIKINALDY